MPIKRWNSGPALTAYPEELAEKERKLIADRRKAADVKENEPLVGLAISGGGIRSATFGLGVLQALAHADVLKKVDYLSTVSGGGYIGAFLGRLYTRGKEKEKDVRKVSREGCMRDLFSCLCPPEKGEEEESNNSSHGKEIDDLNPGTGDTTAAKVRDLLLDRNSKPIRWLRENGRYLTPNGAGDVIAGMAVAVRNFFTIHVLMAFLLLPLALGLAGFNRLNPLCLSVPCAGGAIGQIVGLWTIAGFAVALAAVVAIVYWALVAIADVKGAKPCLDKWRRWLTAAIGMLLLFAAVAALLGFLDILAAMLREYLAGCHCKTGFGFATLTTFVFITAPKIAKKVRDVSEAVIGMGLEAAALIFGAALLVFDLLLHLLAAEAVIECGCCAIWWTMCICAAGLIGLIAIKAWTKKITFLSDSSFAPLYQARLSRAYLGASNTERFGSCASQVTRPMPGDDMDMEEYHPHKQGGPIHLVNVTINETITANNTEHRDRQGVGLCCGPAGLSVGVRHHAVYKNNGETSKPELHGLCAQDKNAFHVFPEGSIEGYERMKLSRWVAVSGAAISTGMGSYNSLGMSLLFGISNLRLGHWWNSGISDVRRDNPCENWRGRLRERFFRCLLPLHLFLLDEWFGRFHGTASQHWYLTDGGHYENTAAYELIRRRLPFIIVCDDGCDPESEYADLGNLVRKARIDFGATVEVLSDTAAQRDFLEQHLKVPRRKKPDIPAEFLECFGKQEDIGWKKPCKSATREYGPKHALMAKITYEDDQPDSLMIILKPSLTGDEDVDIRQYAKANPTFPNQTTGDQVFDEAQWESYRALGFHVASKVFGDKGEVLS